MVFRSIFESDKPALSFELFPPKTPKGEASMYRNVEQLMQFQPDFVTCTYGAGGSTRDKTLGIVAEIRQRFDVCVASHLTVVESSVHQLRQYLSSARDRGIQSIVALRGDPPAGTREFQVAEGGLRYANQLVELIRSEFPEFGIAVAGYPETHIEAPSAEVDLTNLKRKVDAGADVVITQLFYDNDDFFRFRDRCRNAGIRQPIVPGILPVTNLQQAQRISTLCGAKLPVAFASKLQEQDDPQWHYDVGVEHATTQVRNLIENDADGLHFYVLNKSRATRAILSSLEGQFEIAH